MGALADAGCRVDFDKHRAWFNPDLVKRRVHLARSDMQVGQITFLLRRGKGLVQQYLDLLYECESDKNMSYHLKELMRLGTGSGGKKASRRRNYV